MINEEPLRRKISQSFTEVDPAHDLAHFERVVANAKKLAIQEGARFEVVVPAAWLHDLVNVPKNDPRRSQVSALSAQEAIQFLKELEYQPQYFDDIAHAIQAHSFSAKIAPRTLEAKVVQDADRLDALGAVGVARCFIVGGLLRRTMYDLDDPFARERPSDDSKYTLDHFYSKLLKIAETFQTQSGQKEAKLRVHWMKAFLTQFESEITI